jgi:hypothetical protein
VWSGSYRSPYEGISRKNNTQLTWEMSDHLSLWIELNTDDDRWKADRCSRTFRRRARTART